MKQITKNQLFQAARSIDPGRSLFDLSNAKTFTADYGYLYPVQMQEVLPSDNWEMGVRMLIRAMPLVAPTLSPMEACTYSFFIPNRLVWDDWELFITGGKEGTDATPLPVWQPTLSPSPKNGIGSLWDFMGLPPGVNPVDSYPVDFIRRAYNLVWNQYFRDENWDAEVALSNEDLLSARWQKDYFTSALKDQQRGLPIAFPISGFAPITGSTVFDSPQANNLFNVEQQEPGGGTGTRQVTGVINGANSSIVPTYAGAQMAAGSGLGFGIRDAVLNTYNTLDGDADLSAATTFNIADFRLAAVLQQMFEVMNVAGYRYTEMLTAFFGVQAEDSRLQRAEFIGGTKTPIVISEVLQTSASDAQPTPQGNLAGHGIASDQDRIGSFYAKEHGFVLTLFCLKPKPAYTQGISRQLTRRTRFDYYNPLFANLSEQAVLQREIFATATPSENETVFGFQGFGDEYRQVPSSVAGLMHSTFDYWHQARKFSSAPVLGSQFLTIDNTADDLKRIFAVPSEPGFVVAFGNLNHVSRPMPWMAVPGIGKV